MPDFFESLIERARGGAGGLEPRTPALFEPTPPGYGPGGGPGRLREFEMADTMEAPIEERLVSPESKPSRGAAVAPVIPRAAGRAAEPASAEAATASWDDEALAHGATPERESGRVEPASRAASRRAVRGTSQPAPAPGATAPLSPALSADAAVPSGRDVRGRGATSRGRPSLLPSAAGQARAFPQRPGASESRATSDRHAAETSSNPPTRHEAERGALGRAEPIAVDSGRTPSATVVIKTIDPMAQRPLAAAPVSAPPRYIHVSIGQVEVRAAPSAAASPRARPGTGAAPTGLDEYLRRRNGGAA